jgi:hypothetical protein
LAGARRQLIEILGGDLKIRWLLTGRRRFIMFYFDDLMNWDGTKMRSRYLNFDIFFYKKKVSKIFNFFGEI